MTLETRLRDHLAAKAATIPADPPPLPAPRPRVRPALRLAAAAAAAAVVLLAISAAAWLFRAGETVEPVAPDLEELTPTLQGSLLEWTRAQLIEPGRVVGVMAVDGEVVLFASTDVQSAPATPLRMWRGPAGTALLPVEIDPSGFGPLPVVTSVVWDGELFHAFGGRFNVSPVRGAAEVVETLAWTSPDGRDWDERPLVDPDAGRPYVARTALVTDAAASERGVVAAAVLGESFDWEAYLADQLGDGYVPGSLSAISYDGLSGRYELRDDRGVLLAEPTRAEISFDLNARSFATAVLHAPPGGPYRQADVPLPQAAVGAVSVQATGAGLFVLNTGGPAAEAWFSRDGDTWDSAVATVAGDPLEIVRAESWRDVLLGAVSGRPGRTVVASPDGASWAPISPPLVAADGLAGAADGIAAGGAGIFVHGSQIQVGSGPLEVVIPKGDYRVLAYPQRGRILINPADSTEPVLIASFADLGPGGLPRGFEEGPGGSVRAVDPDTGDVLLELTAAEWAQVAVPATGQTALARGWFTSDGERWGLEDLAAEFGAPGLVHAAVVTEDAVVVLFEREPPPQVTSPIPGAPLEVWVGRLR